MITKKHTEKKRLMTFLTVFAAIVFLSPSFSQQPVSMQGTWELSLTNTDRGWDGTVQRYSLKVTSYIYQYIVDPVTLPKEPNLRLVIQGEEPMPGFVRNETVVFFRNNSIAHCGGPEQNFGFEIISGRLLGNGRIFSGTGMGFDSNPGCGSTWTYTLTATKISDQVPEP